MNEAKLSALLTVLNPAVIQIIMDTKGLTNIEAAKLFYNSDVYAMLENESSKLWHLSALTLYELLEEELTSGTIHYPEEA
jgi:hypothetical protein